MTAQPTARAAGAAAAAGTGRRESLLAGGSAGPAHPAHRPAGRADRRRHRGFFVLDAGGYLTAPYDFDYMASSLINAVPLAMLGLAELLVILSGRGGIDLSVGAIVSLAGMVFGFAYGQWGWPLLPAILLTAAFGALVRGPQRLPRRLRRVPGADRDPGDVLRLQVAGHRDQRPEPDQHAADPEPVLDHTLRGAAGDRRVRPGRPAGPVHLPAPDRRWSCGCCSPAPRTAGASTPSAPTTSPGAGPGSRCAAPASRPTSTRG